MHVLFVEPEFPRNQREFVRALAAVGARVTAIGEAPPAAVLRATKSSSASTTLASAGGGSNSASLRFQMACAHSVAVFAPASVHPGRNATSPRPAARRRRPAGAAA